MLASRRQALQSHHLSYPATCLSVTTWRCGVQQSSTVWAEPQCAATATAGSTWVPCVQGALEVIPVDAAAFHLHQSSKYRSFQLLVAAALTQDPLYACKAGFGTVNP